MTGREMNPPFAVSLSKWARTKPEAWNSTWSLTWPEVERLGFELALIWDTVSQAMAHVPHHGPHHLILTPTLIEPLSHLVNEAIRTKNTKLVHNKVWSHCSPRLWAHYETTNEAFPVLLYRQHNQVQMPPPGIPGPDNELVPRPLKSQHASCLKVGQAHMAFYREEAATIQGKTCPRTRT